MKAWLNRQNPTSVLGLTFDGRRVEGVVVRRANGSAEAGTAVSFELTSDLLTGEVTAVAAELRAQLDAAGIRERRCVVGLPLEWALTLAMPLPDLPEEDLAGLLQLEAERGFPYSPEALVITQTRFVSGPGGAGAMQIAVPLERVVRVEQILRAARLIPVSFTLAFPVLATATADPTDQAVTLEVGHANVSLAVGGTGGFAALRSLAGMLDTSGAEHWVRADQVARELRVTFGQLAADTRDAVKRLRIVGSGAAADRLASDLQARAATLGLAVERVTTGTAAGLGLELPPGRILTGSLTIAVHNLARRPVSLEFLPPRLSAWQSFTSRHSSKRLAHAGMVAGGVAAIVLLAFLIQQYQLMSLEKEWKGIAARVEEVDRLQGQIKRFRPWFDQSYRTLAILRGLTEAFPEDGTVTAKTIEMRDAGVVVCSGTARDNAALLKTLDHLRSANQVSDVQVETLRGKSPLVFTFNFRWDNSARQL